MVAKCVGLILLLILALSWVAGLFRGLPEGAMSLFLLPMVVAVWLGIYGCRRIIRTGKGRARA